MTTSASIKELLSPVLDNVYVETGKSLKPQYSVIFDVQDMPKATVENQQVSGLGVLQEVGESDGFALDDIIIGGATSFAPTAYALKVKISHIAWRDELYGVLKEMVRCLAKASSHRVEISAFSAFNSAFDTAVDGFESTTSLCSTSHVGIRDGETRANRPAVDVGLSHTAIQNMVIHFADMEDEGGFPALMNPSMILITPSDLMIAREILGSSLKPYTDQNEINALVEDGLSYMSCNYLTVNRAWFGLAAKGVHDLKFYWRDRPVFDMYDNRDNKDAIANVYQRHTNGVWSSWRGVYGSYVV